MFIDTLVVTDFQTNCYLVAAQKPSDARDPRPCLVIDPGGEGDLILARLRHLALSPHGIVNTHGHVDHIGANADLKKAFPKLAIAVGRDDARMLSSPMRNMALFFAHWTKSPPPDRLLTEGDRIEAAGVKLTVRKLPGHTRGHIVLVAAGENPPIVFSGDTVFAGSIGRTDLPGGSHETLIESIARVLLVLPPETVLYPGHGPTTTVAAELAQNPFLHGLQAVEQQRRERSCER